MLSQNFHKGQSQACRAIKTRCAGRVLHSNTTSGGCRSYPTQMGGFVTIHIRSVYHSNFPAGGSNVSSRRALV